MTATWSPQDVENLEALHSKSGTCPGCDGPRGMGPEGCCAKCWRDLPKRRHICEGSDNED